MTENEAMCYLGCFEYWNEDDEWLRRDTMKAFVECCAEALKEVQQYREIGTVEECREAREKQTPNKPKDGLYGHGYFACGSCKNPLDGDESYCPQCGQAIRWEN